MVLIRKHSITKSFKEIEHRILTFKKKIILYGIEQEIQYLKKEIYRNRTQNFSLKEIFHGEPSNL